MLKSLHIENFALIDKLDIEFEPGLNIITGETGAGKSILIDALGSTIGEKISSESLRKGASRAVVEGIFSIDHLDELKKYLKDSNLEDFDDIIILRKEISDTLRNRAFVNDSPVPNTNLIVIGDHLVDLHGQHEHQSLLNVNYHITYLDEFGGFREHVALVEQSYTQFMRLKEKLLLLQQREKTIAEKRDVYLFQISEIDQVKPLPGEDDELIQEEKILKNAEKLFQTASELFSDLYENEQSVYDRLSDGLRKFEELVEIDAKLAATKSEFEAAQVAVEEVAKFMQRYTNDIEFNPDRLEAIRARLSLLSGLKRKYHRSLEELIVFRESLEQELQSIENLEIEMNDVQTAIENERSHLSQLCLELSAQRSRAAVELETLVEEQLSHLGMKNAQFKITIQQTPDENGAVLVDGGHYRATALGIDQVEFFISANLGEEVKPLAKVASGGEVSRIMLAIKSSLARADRIPVLIFDEIDIGISGRIAQAVGLSLKRLSKSHQVICITHLPQIASMADQHFVVEKFSDATSTRTRVRKLHNDERALEVAKLLGGESVSETHIRGAVELIEEARKYSEPLKN